MSNDSAPSSVSAEVRIANSTLTDQELAYIFDLISFTRNIVPLGMGWDHKKAWGIRHALKGAADIRGIKDGAKAVTQIVDLRA